jgi:hypothetical protein
MIAARGARHWSRYWSLRLEPLRFAEWTVDGLVQVLARPGLGIAPLIDADEQRTLSARNNLPKFAGHNLTPVRSWAHNRRTGYRGD